MFVKTLLGTVAVIAGLSAGALADPVPQERVSPAGSTASDPCSFYRAHAYGQGIDHYTTEVVWACEAVAQRRATGQPLSDRVEAVEFALRQYRAALVADTRRRFAHAPAPGTTYAEARERARRALAEESGMLAALEAIREGF
jgi:hypothetical protein